MASPIDAMSGTIPDNALLSSSVCSSAWVGIESPSQPSRNGVGGFKRDIG